MALSRPARAPLPNPAVGSYLFTNSPSSTNALATLGNGSLRLAPWVVETTLRFDRIGGEVSVVGEAGSLLRIGIYYDNGSDMPGVPLLDAGTIAGDVAAVQDITVSTTTVVPGLYWIGGAVQSAPTTQPTVRTIQNWVPPVMMRSGSVTPGVNATVGCYNQNSVTGALPNPFVYSASSNPAPRIHIRLA